MSDGKYFQRGKAQELKAELALAQKESKPQARKNVLKKIVANVTMGNDMSSLFADVVACADMPSLEVKKMIYLYLMTHAKHNEHLAKSAFDNFYKASILQNFYFENNPLVHIQINISRPRNVLIDCSHCLISHNPGLSSSRPSCSSACDSNNLIHQHRLNHIQYCLTASFCNA